jgi:two-component system, OmpR family, response regulator
VHKLLLIDDDTLLGPPLAAFFKRYGFDLQQATTPTQGLAVLQASQRASQQGSPIQAAILDVMLPEMDGFELCRRIRKTSNLPIIMLTARGEVMDRVVGLELGADDYLPKPFEPRELLARLQTVLRRTGATTGTATATLGERGVLRFEGLTIDLDRRTVELTQGVAEATQAGPTDRAIALTSTEFELLALLAGSAGKVFSRDDILAGLRGHAGQDIHSRAVDILVSRLRKKLEPLDVVRTLRNAGYLFAAVRVR